MEEGQWAWGTNIYPYGSMQGERVLMRWERNGWSGVEVVNRWAPSQVTGIVAVDRPADLYRETVQEFAITTDAVKLDPKPLTLNAPELAESLKIARENRDWGDIYEIEVALVTPRSYGMDFHNAAKLPEKGEN